MTKMENSIISLAEKECSSRLFQVTSCCNPANYIWIAFNSHFVQTTMAALVEKNPLSNFIKYEGIVLEPYKYVTSLPSKNIRRKIAELFNYWFQAEEKEFESVCQVVNTFHNASLIIDDIEDGSDLRRGFPATHLVHGLPQAINSANYVYFKAMEEVMKIYPPGKHPSIIELVVKGLMDLHIGQGVEMFWRDENIKAEKGSLIHVPTEEEYYDVIVKKTSRQFTLLAELTSESLDKSDQKKQRKAKLIHNLADLVGTHFQIRDDLLNLISGSYESGKGFCEDLSEGKFSFPIIRALACRSESSGIGDVKAARLLEILAMQTQDRELKKEALDIIVESGAIDYTKKKVKEFKQNIAREILRLGGNPLYLKFESVFDDHF